MLVDHAFPDLLNALGGSLSGLSVLDVGCNSGGFSVEAARLGASRVLGVDVVDKYLEQSRFVAGALGLENVSFEKLDVYDVSEESVGPFDVTFCFGLLYHLEHPVLGMRALASVTRRAMLVDTNLLPGDDEQRALWQMTFPAPASEENRAGADTNLWRDRTYAQMKPNAAAARRLLKSLGFPTVRPLRPGPEMPEVYRQGRRRTFLALR